MMLFVDTSAWLGMYDRSDQFHHKAVDGLARIRSAGIELVTTDYIMDESLTLIRMRAHHQAAVNFGEGLLTSAAARLILIDAELRQSAFGLFKKYSDKDLSFTDCTSFALMKRLKLKTAFTFDDHFRQVGFDIW